MNRYKVRYLIVGAYAVTFYTEPRFTKDLDIWVDSDINNAGRLYKALAEFGTPLDGVSIADFANKNMIYQIGVAPVRIDIIAGLKGLQFDKAWKNRKKTKYGGINVNILGLKDLIYLKKKAKRPQDILDVTKLSRKIRKTRHF
ncbi:MAG: nucleotidyltransferase [Candidatus Omnitrophota bacterium]|nr:nucleotidyltransferase [Candidatus Omnitrophota bacterium]